MSINKSSYLKHLILWIGLIVANPHINKALAQNLKLTPQEQQRKSELDQFIDQWYTCIFPQGKFDGENVVDAEWVLTDIEEEQIEQMIEQIKQNNQVKILLVTKEWMRKSGTMENFGTSLGNCLGIGLKRINNGILIQLDIKDHKSFIATWYRSETVLTDAECRRICALWNPYFAKSNIPWGIQAILQWLEEQITVEEVRELTEAEKAAMEAEAEERKQMMYTILMYMLMAWVLWWTGVYLHNQKKKFDELISRYNNKVDWIDKLKTLINQSIQQLTQEYWNLKSYPFEHAPWAWKKQWELLAEVKTIIDSPNATSIMSFDSLSNNRSSFFKSSQKNLNKQIEWIDNTINEAQEINSSLASGLDLIKQFLKQYYMINDYLGSQKDVCISGINSDNQKIEDRHSQWYHFSLSQEQHHQTSINLKKSIAEIAFDWYDFDQKRQHTQDASSSWEQLGQIMRSIGSLVTQFSENHQYLTKKTIADDDINNYQSHYSKLISIIPNGIINSIFDKDIPWIKKEQEKLISSYQNAYSSKDIEQSHDIFNQISEYYSTMTQLTDQITTYYADVIEKKSHTPQLIKECDISITNAQSKLHSDYTNKFASLKNEYRLLKEESNQEKADWISLYNNLEKIKSNANTIASNSIKKFDEEERARQAAIAAEAERQRQENNRKRQEESRRSSNSWWGRFGGWWGWSSW